ncbi:hypothetical protein BGZ94_008923 [Podila epigama]|nr:hypothetical protein BGZ94_008923 [Podila epigama]
MQPVMYAPGALLGNNDSNSNNSNNTNSSYNQSNNGNSNHSAPRRPSQSFQIALRHLLEENVVQPERLTHLTLYNYTFETDDWLALLRLLPALQVLDVEFASDISSPRFDAPVTATSTNDLNEVSSVGSVRTGILPAGSSENRQEPSWSIDMNHIVLRCQPVGSQLSSATNRRDEKVDMDMDVDMDMLDMDSDGHDDITADTDHFTATHHFCMVNALSSFPAGSESLLDRPQKPSHPLLVANACAEEDEDIEASMWSSSLQHLSLAPTLPSLSPTPTFDTSTAPIAHATPPYSPVPTLTGRAHLFLEASNNQLPKVYPQITCLSLHAAPILERSDIPRWAEQLPVLMDTLPALSHIVISAQILTYYGHELIPALLHSNNRHRLRQQLLSFQVTPSSSFSPPSSSFSAEGHYKDMDNLNMNKRQTHAIGDDNDQVSSAGQQ